MIAENMPRRFGRFRTIPGSFAGNALTPAVHAIEVCFHQQDAPSIRASEAGLKRSDQLHPELSQSDLAYAHAGTLPLSPTLDRCSQRSARTPTRAPTDKRRRL